MSAEMTVEVREPKEGSKGATHLINATRMSNTRALKEAKTGLAKARQNGGTATDRDNAETKLKAAQAAVTAQTPAPDFALATSPLTLADLREEITGLKLAGSKAWTFFVGESRVSKNLESARKVCDSTTGESKIVVVLLQPDDPELANQGRELAKQHRDEAVKTVEALSAKLGRPTTTLIDPTEALLDDPSVKLYDAATVLAEARKSVGGLTGDSVMSALASKRPGNLQRKIEYFRLPRTVKRGADGIFVPAAFVAKLEPPTSLEALATDYFVAVNQITTDVRSFSSSWSSKAFTSGFTNLQAELSVSYAGAGYGGAAAASYSTSSQDETKTDESKKTAYIAGVYEVQKLKIYIPPHLIVLADHVTAAFADAITSLKAADRADEHATTPEGVKRSLLRKHAKLVELFDEYGYFVVTHYTIGGKLSSSEETTYTGDATQVANEFEQNFAGSIQGSGGGVTVAVSAAKGKATASNVATTNQKQDHSLTMQAMGGLGLDRGNPQAWSASLGFDNWEIISYDRMVPIQEFMNAAGMAEVRAACKEVADARFAEINAIRISPRFVHRLHKPADFTDLKGKYVVHEPTQKGESKTFGTLKPYADPTWVKVPENRFLIGVRLNVGSRMRKNASDPRIAGPVSALTFELTVTDQEWQARETATATAAIEAKLTADEAPLMTQDLGSAKQFFDTDVIWIPQGKMITAVGMHRHPGAHDRIALRVKVAPLDGKPREEQELTTAVMSPSFHNTQTSDCKPVENQTLIDPGQVIVAIKFTEHRDKDSRICIQMYTTPAKAE